MMRLCQQRHIAHCASRVYRDQVPSNAALLSQDRIVLILEIPGRPKAHSGFQCQFSLRQTRSDTPVNELYQIGYKRTGSISTSTLSDVASQSRRLSPILDVFIQRTALNPSMSMTAAQNRKRLYMNGIHDIITHHD